MVKLTKKERGFVKDYIKTENGTQSALKNYDTDKPRVAANIASENLAKPHIIKAIAAYADRIPDDLLERVHIEGLNASKEVRNEDGEIVMEQPDYAVRHKYLDSGYKLKGSYAPEKRVNVNVEVEANPLIKELADKLDEIYRGTDKPSDGIEASLVDAEA